MASLRAGNQRRHQSIQFPVYGKSAVKKTVSMVEGAALVAAICGRGAPDSRTKFGPQVLRRGGLIEALRKRGVRAQWQGAVWEDSEAVTQRQSVTGFCRQLAGITDALVNSDRFFTVIGGDHSCAAGTWAGAARGLASAGSLGLIWIDAHMDGHTPETTPSGAYHGMPLAALLGRGDPALTAIGWFWSCRAAAQSLPGGCQKL